MNRAPKVRHKIQLRRNWIFHGLFIEYEEQGPISNIPNFGIGAQCSYQDSHLG
jgi:hypothetical protein